MGFQKQSDTSHPTRRNWMKTSAIAATGLGLAAASETKVSAANEGQPSQPLAEVSAENDRDFVIEAGLSEAEADCWELVGKLAGAIFKLPELHPMERQEFTDALHVIQYRILSRPTYAKYLEIAKQSRSGKDQHP